MFRPQSVTVNCAHCGFPFQIPVFSIIDVRQNPELKAALLGGQLNAAQCPSCGRVNYIAGPLLYHDPEKKFLAVYIPAQANIPEVERQKIIGELTNSLMNALPPEQRKGYMLTPQQFFDLEQLVKKVLEMDGVTPEMLAASQKKLVLLDKLTSLQSDETAFKMAVSENQPLLDREIFMILADAIARYGALGQEDQVKALEALRERLMPITEFGRRLLKQRKAVENLGLNPTRAQVLENILKGDLEEVEAITIAVLPMLDYSFFQELTDRIESTQGEEREALEAKRELMLSVLETINKIEEQNHQAAARVADALIKAEDLDQAILEFSPMINERVLDILLRDLQIAQQEGAAELVERIHHVVETIGKAVNDSMPPALNLILQLVDADYPQETKTLLEANKEQINDDFLAMIEAFIEDVAKSDSYEPKAKDNLQRHLNNIYAQAKLMH